jgi:hypothetical protein
MFKRLGHVIGWVGGLAGLLIVLAGVSNFFQLYQRILGKLSGHEYVYDPVMVAQLDFLVKNNVENVEHLKGDLLQKYHWAESAAREAEIERLIFTVSFGFAVVLVGFALRYVIAGQGGASYVEGGKRTSN